MIDLYCERLGPGFWAEPLNALTNLAFVIAAIAAWRLADRRQVLTADIVLLIGLIAAIGIGSWAFHTFASYWALLLDVTPILLLQIAYLWIYGRRIIGIKAGCLLGFVALFLLAVYVSGQFSHLLNGSLGYLPALALILIIGSYHYLHARSERGLLLIGAAVFSLSLAMRTIDIMVCDYLTIGTHFSWHLLNGLLLYLVARALIVNLPSPPRGQGIGGS